MQCFLLIGTIALLQSCSIVSAAPLPHTLPKQTLRVLRRVPYSVVAVDRGDTATSALASPTQTVILTWSTTKTIDTTRTITTSPMAASATIPNIAFTHTVTQPPLTINVASTVIQSQAPVTITVVAGSSSQQSIGKNCETSMIVTSPIITTNAPLISTGVSNPSAETQIVAKSSLSYGTPPMPTTYSTGSSARYTASQAWNATTTSPRAPTATSSITGRTSSIAWTMVP